MSIKVGDRVVYVINTGDRCETGIVSEVGRGFFKGKVNIEGVWDYFPIGKVFPVRMLAEVEEILKVRKELLEKWERSEELWEELKRRVGSDG